MHLCLSGGQRVTVAGVGFSSHTVVEVDSDVCDVVSFTGTQIICVMPAVVSNVQLQLHSKSSYMSFRSLTLHQSAIFRFQLPELVFLPPFQSSVMMVALLEQTRLCILMQNLLQLHA